MANVDDNVILSDLRDITRNRECWKVNIDGVAGKLNKDYSSDVKAKALWLLGEMGRNILKK